MSDDATPRLGIPYLAAGQAQKHVTVNAAFARLDGLVHCAAESRTITVQPASPADGALYILPAGASGEAWDGKPAGTLMRFEAGAWSVAAPAAGQPVFIIDEGVAVVFDGSAWTGAAFERLVAARSPRGAVTGFEVHEQEVTLAGASTATSIVIPARSIVLGVSTRTSEAVTGAGAYGCGVSGEATKFGGSLGAALGSSNIGVIGPTAFYSDTPVVLTAEGGAFTGGKVRVSIHLVTFAASEAE